MFGLRGTGKGELDLPNVVAVSPDSRLWVSDFGRVQAFDLSGKFLFEAAPGHFRRPFGIAFDTNGLVFIGDYGRDRVSVCRLDGTLVRDFGNMTQPTGVAVDGKGTVFVSLYGACSIHTYTREGILIRSWGSAGSAPSQLYGPWGLVFANNELFVSEQDNHRIQVGTTSARFSC